MDAAGRPFVLLTPEGNIMTPAVQAMFDKGHSGRLARLKPRQRLTVACQCEGMPKKIVPEECSIR